MFRGGYHRRLVPVALFLALAGCTGEPDSGGVESLLISNVRIIDGSGAPAVAGSVRVIDGRIAAIGDLQQADGDVVVMGRGLVLAPGFIDPHSHADEALFDQPEALAAVSQGITTVVVGSDGRSPPLATFADRLDTSGAAVNVAMYAGHNTIRATVLGDDFRRTATLDEIAAMQALLENELRAGALGLSTGLEYEPGIHSDTDEVIALAQTAADAGTRYVSHVRSEDRALDAALDEIIEIGRVTGMPVHVSHLKLAMRSLWGQAPRFLAKLDAARESGIDVTTDVYPYAYWQSTMMVLLPERDPTDRAAVEFALDQLAPPDGIRFTRFDPRPAYVGMTLQEIAESREVDAATAFMQLAEEAQRMAERVGDSVERIIGVSMDEADVQSILIWEHASICTDGGLIDRHPRAAGSFPRFLGRYVREFELMSLERAVRKMSGLTADSLGFDDRGYIRVGQAADLVLFDPDTIIDRATTEQPDALADGVAAVWVGGELVYSNGRGTGALPGQFLRR